MKFRVTHPREFTQGILVVNQILEEMKELVEEEIKPVDLYTELKHLEEQLNQRYGSNKYKPQGSIIEDDIYTLSLDSTTKDNLTLTVIGDWTIYPRSRKMVPPSKRTKRITITDESERAGTQGSKSN